MKLAPVREVFLRAILQAHRRIARSNTVFVSLRANRGPVVPIALSNRSRAR